MAEVIACQVVVLDGSIVSIDANKRSPGDYLLTEVFKHLGLVETDYFGLQYLDKKDHVLWLDTAKPIRKQVKREPYEFRFRVKLYPISPTYLFEESTRYFLSLQIRDDLLNTKLHCSDNTLVLLSSYLVQGEYGDYDPAENTQGYLDDFRFLADKSPEFVQQVVSLHQRNRGLLPSECDRMFLELACKLDRYGMDFHPVMDISGINLILGVSSKGVTVFCGVQPYLTPLNNFPWVRIAAVNFKNKNLLLEMVALPGQRHTEVIMLACPSKLACKTVWKSCVEHHTFFRTVKTEVVKRSSSGGLFRRGSSFRFSGRTQFRLLQEGSTSRRGSKKFERLTSRNKFARKTI